MTWWTDTYGLGATNTGRDHQGPGWRTAQTPGWGKNNPDAFSLPAWLGHGGGSLPETQPGGMPQGITNPEMGGQAGVTTAPAGGASAGGGWFSGGTGLQGMTESPGMMGMLGGGLALMNAGSKHAGEATSWGQAAGAAGGGLLGGMMTAEAAKQGREDSEKFDKMLEGFSGGSPKAGEAPGSSEQPLVPPKPGVPAQAPMPGEPETMASPMKITELPPPPEVGQGGVEPKHWTPPVPASKPSMGEVALADAAGLNPNMPPTPMSKPLTPQQRMQAMGYMQQAAARGWRIRD